MTEGRSERPDFDNHLRDSSFRVNKRPDVLDNLESLSDEEMARVVFGDVQSHAERL